jgi:hypothetical protein
MAAALVCLAALPIFAESKLPTAVMVEWTVGNCGREGIPSDFILTSLRELTDAPQDEVEATRVLIRQRIARQYPSVAAACAHMLHQLKLAPK